MSRYIKKPIAIEAIKWTGDNFNYMEGFTDNRVWVNTSRSLVIETLEGLMFASVGDMVIKNNKGKCYPCQADRFKLTYYTEQEYAESIE